MAALSGHAVSPVHRRRLCRTRRSGVAVMESRRSCRCAFQQRPRHHEVEHGVLVEFAGRAPRGRPGPPASPAPGRPGRAPRAPRWRPAARRRPSAASARITWYSSARAPTSTPRVGSSSSSSRVPPSSQRPTTTFCWLPPDSVRTGRSTSRGPQLQVVGDPVGGLGSFLAGVGEAEPRVPAERGQRDVAVDRLAEQQRLALAFLRAPCPCRPAPPRRRRRAQRPPVHPRPSRRPARRAP